MTRLQSKWGPLDMKRKGEECVTTGEVKIAGQVFELRLTLHLSEYGWIRGSADDLVLTKVGGENAGKRGQMATREHVLEHLPELVNETLGWVLA